MRPKLEFLIATFLLSISTGVGEAQDLGPQIRKIKDGIYVYVGKNLNSNAGIILTQEGVVLIDSGHSPPDSRDIVKKFVQALSEAISLARSERAAADRIYTRYLKVTDPVLLDFMYRTYVQGAIPQRPHPKMENVALGIAEFASKPGLKGKKAEDITDRTLVRELEKEGFFDRLPGKSGEHGERAK